MQPLANLVIGASGQPDVCGSVGGSVQRIDVANEFPDSVRWIMELPFTAGPDVNESIRRGKCRLHSPGALSVALAESNACRRQPSYAAFLRSRLRPHVSMIAQTTTATVKNDAAANNSRASG